MKYTIIFVILAAVVALAPIPSFAEDNGHFAGAVYAMTNGPEGNRIVVFERDAFGRLTFDQTYDTGGFGIGGGIDPLASQAALVLSSNNRWLFGVNAGSDTISVFRVNRHGLKLAGTFDSNGAIPVSLASYHNLLYVLHAGEGALAPSITGFQLNSRGHLTPLEGSTRVLPGNGFHQVGFTPNGDRLIVTKGGADDDAILVFSVDEDGQADAAPTISPSVGVVPFAFIFDRQEHLLVAEAGSGAVTSYAISDDNTLKVIDGSVGNGNLATCWIVGTWYGTFFTANTASDNFSGYSVRSADGSLTLRQAIAGVGNKPIDMAVSEDGRFLYALNAAEGTVGAYRIGHNGELQDLGAIEGLPLAYAQGIAAR